MRSTPVMSAKLSSKTSFKYGRVEITATLPRGHSLWPALWMLPTSAGPWPTGGEIDIMESMGSDANEGFALDHQSTSAAIHFGERESWYSLAYTPTYENLKGIPFGSLAARRALADGPHTFGLYWAKDNLYLYVDDDANRVLDMDEVFRLSAQRLLSQAAEAGGDAGLTAERRQLAEEVAQRGYRAGWRKFGALSGKQVPAWLWPLPNESQDVGSFAAGDEPPAEDAPFDRPFHLIMNMAVGGDFFRGNLNPNSTQRAMWDAPIASTGQLPSMYWYSRMKEWWASWSAAPEEAQQQLHPAFASAATEPTAFLQTANTWGEYATGAQDTGSPSAHKADEMATVPPPSDVFIGSHVDLRIHRVVVTPVAGTEVVATSMGLPAEKLCNM
jgi:hypothetical protein